MSILFCELKIDLFVRYVAKLDDSFDLNVSDFSIFVESTQALTGANGFILFVTSNNVDYYYSFNGDVSFVALLNDPSKRILGMQFHPEMSGKFVLKELLKQLFAMI